MTTYETHFMIYFLLAMLRNITKLEDFISALKKIGYNSVNPDYYKNFRRVYASVLKFKTACGVK